MQLYLNHVVSNVTQHGWKRLSLEGKDSCIYGQTKILAFAPHYFAHILPISDVKKPDAFDHVSVNGIIASYLNWNK